MGCSANSFNYGPNQITEIFHGHSVQINNFPQANPNHGFIDEIPSLPDAWNYIIIRNHTSGAIDPGSLKGEKAFDKTIDKLRTWNGSSWDAGISLNNGDILVLRRDEGEYEKRYLYNAITHSLDLTPISTWPILEGRDLFDISSLFNDLTGNEWKDVVKMRVLISNHDFADSQYVDSAAAMNDYKDKWKVVFKINEPPSIFALEDFETVDRPLFASVQGRTFSGTFQDGAAYIVPDILDIIYPERYNLASLTSMLGLGWRDNWKWRAQFTDNEDGEAVLNKLLWALWAVGVFSENDELVFKSLDITEYAVEATKAFDETNILADSITAPEFRKADNIFQSFRLLYSFFPPSSESQSFDKYSLKTVVSRDDGPAELRALLATSENLYNLDNEKEIEFDFHYQADDEGNFPMAKKVIDFFAYNNWTVEFSVSMRHVLGAGNTLGLFDVVSIQHSFFTDNEILKGFIIGMTPNFHEGIVTLKIYIPKPPGVLGPYCDNFKDALFFPSRGAPGADFFNDAGTFPRGAFDYDDAGSFPRTFTC
jgi:hypothetical protein